MDEISAGASVAYLGPAGTFTEQALRQLNPDAVAWAAPTVSAALEQVRLGRLATAVVPFENSVEGSVSATLDELIRARTGSAAQIQIRREAHIEVQFDLVARPGTDPERVRRIGTHPHAEAQTRRWVAQHFPQAKVLPESSTARAAELTAAGEYDAAIASPLAGGPLGLVPLAQRIADNLGAVTRFVEVGQPGPPPAATGADTTTLVAFLRSNRPGALLQLLEQFAVRGIDLSRLESRPTGSSLGQYCFAIDAIGHLDEPRMAEALLGLKRVCGEVVFLGSYPRADGAVQPVPEDAAPLAYREAGAWLEGLR